MDVVMSFSARPRPKLHQTRDGRSWQTQLLSWFPVRDSRLSSLPIGGLQRVEGWGAGSGQTPDVSPTTSQRGKVLVLRAAQTLARSPCCLASGPLAQLGGNSGGDFLLQCCARQSPWTMLLESSRQFIQVPEARRWHRLLCPANLWGPHCRGASGKQLSVGRDGQGGTPLASWDPRPPPRSCPLCVHDGHASCVPASLRSRVGALGVMVMDRGLRGPPSCFSEVPESSTVCLVPDRQH